MTPHSIDELLYHMPTIASMAKTEWAAGFAQSILRQSRRKGWRPSDKQLSCMHKLVADLFVYGADPDQEDDTPLIE